MQLLNLVAGGSRLLSSINKPVPDFEKSYRLSAASRRKKWALIMLSLPACWVMPPSSTGSLISRVVILLLWAK